MGFGTNIVCELFPPIHTEGFHCVGQGHATFTANLSAVCQPNAMQIHSNIIANLHHVLCVKAFSIGCIRSAFFSVPVYKNWNALFTLHL